MSGIALTVTLFCLMLVFLALGIPVAIALGVSAVILGLVTLGESALLLMCTAILNNMRTIVLIALPLFIFMGNILQSSGLVDRLYQAVQNWTGRLNGGLAVATVLVCTVFAACTGVSAAATVTMGLIALPAMLRRGYDVRIAIGSIMGGGALGQLIPPSLIFILYGFMAEESIGRLFAGGVLPGLILSGLFIVYVLVRCKLRPSLGPPVPTEELASWRERLSSLRSVILPALLVVSVLGSIFSGIATPTEAAAIGAAGAIICGLINRQLTFTKFRKATYATILTTSMVMWMVVGATAFTTIFSITGAMGLIKKSLLAMDVSPLLIIIFMQATFFILGCFIDPTGIILICTPIYVPVIRELGFSGVWFGVIFCINMEMAFLTPPYGMNLFYMKGIVPKEVSMTDIYLSAGPFVLMQAITLAIAIAFPSVATWLPNLMFGKEI